VDAFDEWRSGGTELRWESSTAANVGREVKVFSRRCGTPDNSFTDSSVDDLNDAA